MSKCIAILLALFPATVFCQDVVEVISKPDVVESVATPLPMVFTVAVDSYSGAKMAMNQVALSDPGSLLQWPNVLSELGLVDEQKRKLDSRLSELAKEFAKKSAEFSKSFDGLPESAERQARAHREYTEGVNAAANDILLPSQLDRLNQIRFQTIFRNDGSASLQSDEFAELLSLSPEQKQELGKKAMAAEQKLMEDFQVRRQKAHRELLKDVLTPKQLKLFDESLGKPIDEVSK